MTAFAHTPYDGSHPMFRIGLHPLDLAKWIEVDDNLGAHLAEKARLDEVVPERVFVAEPGTENAQQEVLDLLVDHLRLHNQATHTVHSDSILVAGQRVALSGDAPLKIAGHLVQEDLVLMRRNGDGSGWRLAAASLHFPSSWALAEKFGKPMSHIHAPVPGFSKGTRNASLIDRIFDNLAVDLPVWRMNFSLYDNGDLHHPEAKHGEGFDNGYGHVSPEMFIRVEYQTLRKLPKSGDIVFTIRIHVDAMRALAQHPDRARLGAGLIASLDALDEAQLRYKGMAGGKRALLKSMLSDIIQAGNGKT